MKEKLNGVVGVGSSNLPAPTKIAFSYLMFHPRPYVVLSRRRRIRRLVIRHLVTRALAVPQNGTKVQPARARIQLECDFGPQPVPGVQSKSVDSLIQTALRSVAAFQSGTNGAQRMR